MQRESKRGKQQARAVDGFQTGTRPVMDLRQEWFRPAHRWPTLSAHLLQHISCHISQLKEKHQSVNKDPGFQGSNQARILGTFNLLGRSEARLHTRMSGGGLFKVPKTYSTGPLSQAHMVSEGYRGQHYYTPPTTHRPLRRNSEWKVSPSSGG